MLPSTCLGSLKISSNGNRKREILNFNTSTSSDSNSFNLGKRSQPVCSVALLANGYDWSKSSTAAYFPGLFQDSDFSQSRITTTTNSGKLKARSK